jgi:hypothetical protein
MDLPIRFLEAPVAEPVVKIDGAWAGPGLDLSHWPGNRTPEALRHDLSTGVALRFARLPPAERARLAAGCVALAVNHLDTDGVLALWAVRHPEAALRHEDFLLEAAATGDWFRLASARALRFDLLVQVLADPARSPWRESYAGLSDARRRERCIVEIVARLEGWLDAGRCEHEELVAEECARIEADRAALAECRFDDLLHLDLAVWNGTRAGAPFDPARHALCGSSVRDRLLALAPVAGGGTSCRFLVNTTSWFPLAEPRLPRPDLARLAARLDQLEGTERDGCRWRAQPSASPSPELWFGRDGVPFFAERNGRLEASRLEPQAIKREVVDALRAAWTFPDD